MEIRTIIVGMESDNVYALSCAGYVLLSFQNAYKTKGGRRTDSTQDEPKRQHRHFDWSAFYGNAPRCVTASGDLAFHDQ